MIVFSKIIENIIPIIICIVFTIGIYEKKDVFKLFIDGAEEGVKYIVRLIPIIIAFFFFSGTLISSNIINDIFEKILKICGDIKYVFIVSVIKSFSGSAGISLGIEVLEKVGVDSILGIILSIILASTETTLYVISIYLGKFKNKRILPICVLGLLCDFIIVIICFWFLY